MLALAERAQWANQKACAYRKCARPTKHMAAAHFIAVPEADRTFLA